MKEISTLADLQRSNTMLANWLWAQETVAKLMANKKQEKKEEL